MITITTDTDPTNYYLPPVDANSPDLLISSDGLAIWAALGQDIPVGPNAFSCYQVPAGGSIVITDAAANATVISVVAMQRGGRARFQRLNASNRAQELTFPVIRR